MEDKLKAEITLEQLVERVGTCTPDEADAVLDALRRRYQHFFQGWQVILEAYPLKNTERDGKPQLTLLKKQ